MKQPELGKRISEMRKAKGLTQEELVELCNLNVRTIQRIEAGEVTPRSYTVKALFEALGIEWNQSENDVSIKRGNEKPFWLYAGLTSGLIYFMLSYFEISMEVEWLAGMEVNTASFISIKMGVFLTFSLFLIGLIKLSYIFPNRTFRLALYAMLAANALWYSIDLIALGTSRFAIEDYYYVKVSSFGLFYGLMGLGLLTYKNLWSNITQVIGALGVVSGILMFSVIGAGIGLVPLTMFELGLIIFLVWGINKIGRRSSPDSTFTAELQS
ncbi:helix-turn-helix domain-containing protein [Algoriphagus chordae]|nr:helix-turn-helix transcriptional regulator [Algoriphagus chordae]